MQNSVILVTTGTLPGGLSPNRGISVLYGQALMRAGLCAALYGAGAPADLADRFDGLLLTGGGDLEPALYGQRRASYRLSLDPVRDSEELALTRAFCAARKPILGICRGIQVLNVFFGGALVQDVSGHDGAPHPVTAVPGTRTAELCGGVFKTNSYHHQAISRLGDGLRATAYAGDGLIEAVEHSTLPILGVQWHPERMIPGLCADTAADHTGLFAWLYSMQRNAKT